ncbi:uncharacterized protein [Dermacentor albipictus]|uniref:uncharacterized protein n=1 Tax=Dermacentor albipictus TaxID=60249 RepID=UPI0031FD97D5
MSEPVVEDARPKGSAYRKAAQALPIAGAMLFLLAAIGLFSFFLGHGSSDEFGAAAKMRVDDSSTTDTVLAFRRALDAERPTDRTEPMPLLTDRAQRYGVTTIKLARRKNAIKNMTKTVTKKMTKKTTETRAKGGKTKKLATTPAKGVRQKTSNTMAKHRSVDKRSGRRTTAIGARKKGSLKPEQRSVSSEVPRIVVTKHPNTKTVEPTRKKLRGKINAPDAEKTSTKAGVVGEDEARAIAEDVADYEALVAEQQSGIDEPHQTV